MADVKRTWIKDAFWETPSKELLNCISEHKEGFKDVPGSKITRPDFKSYVESVEFNKILNSYYKEKTKNLQRRNENSL